MCIGKADALDVFPCDNTSYDNTKNPQEEVKLLFSALLSLTEVTEMNYRLVRKFFWYLYATLGVFQK